MNAETLQRVGVQPVQPTVGYGGWHARTLHGLHGGCTHVARGGLHATNAKPLEQALSTRAPPSPAKSGSYNFGYKLGHQISAFGRGALGAFCLRRLPLTLRLVGRMDGRG
jgi:hypothetical protein